MCALLTEPDLEAITGYRHLAGISDFNPDWFVAPGVTTCAYRNADRNIIHFSPDRLIGKPNAPKFYHLSRIWLGVVPAYADEIFPKLEGRGQRVEMNGRKAVWLPLHNQLWVLANGKIIGYQPIGEPDDQDSLIRAKRLVAKAIQRLR